MADRTILWTETKCILYKRSSYVQTVYNQVYIVRNNEAFLFITLPTPVTSARPCTIFRIGFPTCITSCKEICLHFVVVWSWYSLSFPCLLFLTFSVAMYRSHVSSHFSSTRLSCFPSQISASMVTTRCSTRGRSLFHRQRRINRNRKRNWLKRHQKRMVRISRKRRFVCVRKFGRPRHRLFKMANSTRARNADTTGSCCGSGC